MVFYFRNYSTDRGKTFEEKLRSVEQFLKQNSFLTCSWRRFLRSYTLEQLEFKLEKCGKKIENMIAPSIFRENATERKLECSFINDFNT